MRTLSGIPNTDAPSSDYPNGRIRNKDNTAIPPIVGTPVIEQLYGDIIQFFQRLLVLGSVTANNLADNVTNGYQTITALWNAILDRFAANADETISGGASDKFITPQGLSAKTALETRIGLIELANISEILAETDNERAITPAGLASKKASDAEVIAGTDTKKYVTSAGLAAKDAGLRTVSIDIGDWDMNTSPTKDVTGINSLFTIPKDNIREITVTIRPDSDAVGLVPKPLIDGDLNGICKGGISGSGLSSGNLSSLSLSRTDVGVTIYGFDNNNYNETSYNRGWIIIRYIP